ncbi:MAG: hypothetical protein GPJ54_18015 [Candidatus Heimdallarchaeota archaeon]|nr:hypothetical protein [Candidatus Heimdallarchaeota archaeon]
MGRSDGQELEFKIHSTDTTEASFDWIGMEVKTKFSKLIQLKPTYAYFIPK